MSLGIEDLRAARYCVAEVLRDRRRAFKPIPEWLRRADTRLDAELQAAMSAAGQPLAPEPPGSNLIGTAEAARILGCTPRTVRRLAADLDGQRVGQEWAFTRTAVTEYATARKGEPNMANECTPLFRPGKDITGLAAAAITGKTFVDVSANRGADGLIRVATAAAGARAFGVAAADIASGAIGPILRGGILPVTAGGTIAAGDEVEVGTGGKAVTLASGKAVGKAVESGASNNPVMIALY